MRRRRISSAGGRGSRVDGPPQSDANGIANDEERLTWWVRTRRSWVPVSRVSGRAHPLVAGYGRPGKTVCGSKEGGHRQYRGLQPTCVSNCSVAHTSQRRSRSQRGWRPRSRMSPRGIAVTSLQPRHPSPLPVEAVLRCRHIPLPSYRWRGRVPPRAPFPQLAALPFSRPTRRRLPRRTIAIMVPGSIMVPARRRRGLRNLGRHPSRRRWRRGCGRPRTRRL